MEYKIHFVIEADIEVEAKDWNEAEAEFDLRKKELQMGWKPSGRMEMKYTVGGWVKQIIHTMMKMTN